MPRISNMDGESGRVPRKASSLGIPPQNRSALPSQHQPEGKSHWFMQRPKASGVDPTSFSFAKPASHRQGFALPNLPKRAPFNATTGEITRSRESQDDAAKDSRHLIAQLSTLLPRLEDSRAADADADANIVCNALNNISEEDLMSASIYRGDPVSLTKSKDANMNLNATSDIVQQQAPKPFKSMVDEVLMLNTNNDPETEVNTSPQASLGSSHVQVERIDTTTATYTAPEIQPPVKDDLQSTKCANRVRKVKSAKRQKSNPTKFETQQFSEDRLFELLIGRIKLREENEAAAAYLQQQLEVQNGQLTDENRDLQQQMQALHERLEKSNEECKANRSLLGGWKTKVRDIKKIVNELGNGYDTLRDEADQLKDTVLSLSEEKCDFTKTINGMKQRITQAEGTIELQRNKTSESKKTIASLEQALQSSQEMKRATQSQLSDHKRQIATLESYIEGHALAQSKQLVVLKEHQELLFEKLATGISTITKDLASVNSQHVKAVKDAFDECRSSVQILAEESSEQQLNVSEFTERAHEISDRIDSLSSQFTSNVEGSIKISNGVSKTIQKRLREFESNIGPGSPIIKQLGSCLATYGALKERLEVMEPTLGSLEISVKRITATESNLIHEIEDMSKKISEAQIPTNNSVLEMELASKFAENTQLQIRLHDLTSQSEGLKEANREKDATIEGLQRSLLEATDRQQSVESQNKRLAIEKTDLRLEFESTERSIRQELDEKNLDCLNQIRSKHQLQVQCLQKEKDDVEKVAGELITQLELVQQSLIEAKRLVGDQAQESKLLVQEKERRVEELEKIHIESIAQLAIQAEEIQKFQELDATSRVENTDLGDRLEQAQQKILDLERKINRSIQIEGMRTPQAADIVPFAAIQKQLAPQPGTSQYGESCDFAMLFMSDEICPSTVANDAPSPRMSPGKRKDVVGGDDENDQRPESIDTSFPSPKKMELPDQDNKRGTVNTKAQQGRAKAKKPSKAQATATRHQSVTSQVRMESEERPTKVSKHTHKWTYSRIHSAASMIQQEQARASHPRPNSTVERRTSPKTLVSASSEQATAKPKTRARPRRRSRGDKYDARFQMG